MATSGSWNYSQTAANIIQGAMENIGALVTGESPTSDESTLGLRTLNLIAKQWAGDTDFAPGFKIWTRQRVTLFLAKDQYKYVIGPTASEDEATTSYGRTTVSTAYSSGTTLVVASLTDTTTDPGSTKTITNSDVIGVELDDGTIDWRTVSDASTTSLTISSGLSSAAAVGNYVWYFTSRAQRFPAIEYAVLRDQNLQDTPLRVMTDVREYESLPDKQGSGDPTAILVEPLLTTTRITLDFAPTSTGVVKQIVMTVFYPGEDYDATTDDIAFPQEYYLALEWELAFRLAPKFRREWTPTLQANYDRALAVARQLNPMKSAEFFQPHSDGHA